MLASRLRRIQLPRRIPLSPRLVVAAAVLAVAPVLASAVPASAQTVNYVALGDSYSSGLGAGSYSGGSCYRSAHAYPQLWDNAYAPSSFSFAACSGAKTTDVESSQLSSVSSSTSLISITIGGNDVGFSSVMETCVLESTSACTSAVHKAENTAETQLPGWLDTLFSDMSARAPNATVVVLGYPEFYDLSKSSTCIGLSTTDRTNLNQGADILDGVIQAAAGRHGFRYADVRSAFAGHEICDSSSWLNSVDWTYLTASYHPTAAGQAGAYYPVFNAAA